MPVTRSHAAAAAAIHARHGVHQAPGTVIRSMQQGPEWLVGCMVCRDRMENSGSNPHVPPTNCPRLPAFQKLTVHMVLHSMLAFKQLHHACL